MDFKRKDLESKKEFYRRMAQIRKNNWANQHKYCEDQNIKSHFTVNEESCSTEENKSKKIAKGELRTEQRLRNRVAAQESRERHRFYVEELQKKVRMYEELLEKHGGLCKNCRKNLLSEVAESQTIIAEDNSQQNSSQNLLNPKVSQQQILNSYLNDNDQLIRIDNTSAATPFGIFFVVCLIAVLAVFSFSPTNTDITPRLLANYQSTVNQLISMQDKYFQQNKLLQHAPKVMEISTMEHKDDQLSFDKQNTFNNATSLLQKTPFISKNWTKYGDYVCSQPSIILKSKSAKEKNGPEFLLLRTGRNQAKPLKKLKITLDEKQGHRINLQSNQWEGVQISSCFRGDL